MSNRLLGPAFASMPTLFNAGSVGGMTDGQLLERFLARRDEGAEAAFSALVTLHGPMVWTVCRGILADPHAAEDAFQATFLILVRKVASIRRRDTIGPWLHGVSRRVAVRARTVAIKRRSLEGQDTKMGNTSNPDPSQREQLEVLHQEVDRLPEKYRAPVVLCHFEGRTHAEAARLLNWPVGTVSIRLSRAREQLKARLTRRGVVLSAGLAGAALGGEPASAAVPAALADSTTRVAMSLAAGGTPAAGIVPAAASQLAEGELKSMLVTRLMVAGAGVLASGMIAAGARALMAGERPPQAVQKDMVRVEPARESFEVTTAPVPVAAAPEKAAAGDAEAREKTKNNLKQIGLAMHNFASANMNRFPPAAIRRDGKPLLSWRVAILPYIEQAALYEKFHLNEPWDSPHNNELLKEMPETYAPVVGKGEAPYSTYYQAIVGPGALFDGDRGSRLAEVLDGLTFTIMVVEAGKPVPWTKPEDVIYAKDNPLPKLGGQFDDGLHAIMADAAPAFFPKNVAETAIRAVITRNGAEPVSPDQFRP